MIENPIDQIIQGDYYGYINLVIWIAIGLVLLKILRGIAKFIFILWQNRTLVYLKIRLPREESQKDNEKKEENDFINRYAHHLS